MPHIPFDPRRPSDTFRLAAVQTNTGDDVPANLEAAGRLIADAAGVGAQLVALPENFAFMGAHECDKLAHAEADGDATAPIQRFLAETARRHRVYLLGGTVPVRDATDPDRVRAASLLYGPDGGRVARYDKIHLFDVLVGAESYRESASIAPGPLDQDVPGSGLATIARAGADPGGAVGDGALQVGLSVCYDLRFPEWYRRLAARGATLLCVPAAFTHATGQQHWEVLLRARAVENQAWVLAPGQCGTHPGGRRTWGHSMIVGPDGRVWAEADGDAPRVVWADVDQPAQQALRARFPVLAHRRLGVPGSPE